MINSFNKLSASAVFAALALSGFAQTAPAEKPDAGFVALFNGEDLSGWTKRGGSADFKVQDGAIVGTTVAGSPNTFLCTDKDYYNFELRFEVKLDNDELNSGCQIRSHHVVNPAHKNGFVFGYQVEIDTTGMSGFIYDEGGRGWLSQERKNPEKNAAFKKGEWNQYRIVCIDQKLETFINGIAIESLQDEQSIGGLIGLQVHGVKGDPHWSVRWKNIQIKELPDTDRHLTPLFTDAEFSNFETDGGWTFDPESKVVGFKPKPEEYVGRAPWTVYKNNLWLKKEYANFVCEFDYQLEAAGNSGFYFLVQDKKNPPMTGPELQLEESASVKGENTTFHDCAGLMMGQPIKRADKNVFKGAKQWNRMLVQHQDKKLKVWHNGLKVHDIDLNDYPFLKGLPAKGFIALQDHGMPLFFRNMAIKEIE